MNELRQALKKLGEQGTVTTKKHDRFTIDVYVNGVWFGLWDKAKNTFVEQAYYEHHNTIQKGYIMDDLELAKTYQKMHGYEGKHVRIDNVWRDGNNVLCVQYGSDFGRKLNWYHYQINEHGKLEWW